MRRVVVDIVALMVMVVAAGGAVSADKSQVSSVCNCGNDCSCSGISQEPGTCACRKEMKKI